MVWKFFTPSLILPLKKGGGQDKNTPPHFQGGGRVGVIKSFIIHNSSGLRSHFGGVGKFIILAVFLILAGIAVLRYEGLWWDLHYEYNLPRLRPPLEFISPEPRFEKTSDGILLKGEPIYFNFTLPKWYNEATVILTLTGKTGSNIYVGTYRGNQSVLSLWRAGFLGEVSDGVKISLDGSTREQGLQQIFIGVPDLKASDTLLIKKVEFYFRATSRRAWLKKIL